MTHMISKCWFYNCQAQEHLHTLQECQRRHWRHVERGHFGLRGTAVRRLHRNYHPDFRRRLLFLLRNRRLLAREYVIETYGAACPDLLAFSKNEGKGDCFVCSLFQEGYTGKSSPIRFGGYVATNFACPQKSQRFRFTMPLSMSKSFRHPEGLVTGAQEINISGRAKLFHQAASRV